MRIIIFILLLVFTNSYSQQTNVVVALIGTVAGEPHLQDSFVLGYESTGGTYSGTFTILENTSVVNGFKYADTNNYTCVLRNSGNHPSIAIQTDSFYSKGIQFITCGGDNAYQQNIPNNVTLTHAITCGAGESANMTSYPIEFYGIHYGYNFPITNIVQGLGDTLTTTVDISTNGVFFINYLYRVVFSNVFGFSNNPNGIFQPINSINGYTGFTMIHNAGTGSFTSGNVAVFYQSYSHAYIAGQLAYIKDQLNCTWWEARYRARVTGSEGGVYTAIYNGYGRVNITSAINYGGSIPADPYNTLEGEAILTVNKTNNSFTLNIDTVKNAIRYELYDNDSLLKTVYPYPAFVSSHQFTFNRKFKSQGGKHNFHYKAVRGEEEILSETINKNWLSYPKVYKK